MRKGTSTGTIAAAIVAVLVVSSVAAALVYTNHGSSEGSALPSTSSLSSASSAANTTASSASSSQSSTTSATSAAVSTDAALLAQCPGSQPSSSQNDEQPFGTVVTGTSSPAIICVQFYYYNSTGPLTLDLTNGLSIRAGTLPPFDGASNFTVTASQDQLVIGGPTDSNEGTVVAFGVTAQLGASGTYQLGLFSNGSNEYNLGSQSPDTCGSYGQLVAGDGQPDYVYQYGHCLTYATVNTTYSPSYTLPGVPYPLLPGDIYFRVVGVTNSTG